MDLRVMDLRVMDMDLRVMDMDLRVMVLASDWSRDRPLRILTLRYAGLEGLLLASNNLSSRRPRIG